MSSSIRKNNVLELLILCVLTLFSMSQANAMEPALWQKLKDGEAVAIMRHAIAPGNGDPSNFTLGECETQRNLSEEGRLQSQRIGELFRSNGIEQAAVYSSQWCRCVDTANGLSLGATNELAILNSFYEDRSTASDQTAALLSWLQTQISKGDAAPNEATVLVSHQVNITGLTGVYPASGEIVLVTFEDEKLVVLGTVETE